jgi:hypothetical protein
VTDQNRINQNHKETNIMKSTLLAAAISGIVVGASGLASAATLAQHQASGTTAVNSALQLDDKAPAKHDCKGKNACKGQGGCKTDKHACKAQNACKGQGGCKG